MNKLSFGVVLLIALGFVSCETDIDVNAEPTDVAIVYGLIDPADTVHYLKINKAFIGEGSALDLAANSSNYTYTDAELNVRLDGDGKSYSLIRVTNEIPKDDGVFDNTTNVLYKFNEPSINIDATYNLKIVNIPLDKEITAETKIVGNSLVESPKPGNTLSFWSGDVSSGNAVQETVSVLAGDNVGRVQAYIVFNYIENYTLASGKVPVSKKVILNLGEKKTASSSSNKLNFLVKGQNFLDNIKNSVPNSATISHFSHRELDNISIELSAAGSELSTYMEAEAPSTTVNQDKPSYTNLTNAIGIFSSRTYDASWRSNKSASTGLNMDTDTKRKLGSLGLGFCLGTNTTATNPCNQL
jgi:hypothetical protein